MDQQQIKEVINSSITNAIEALEKSEGIIEVTFGTDYFETNSFPMPFQDDDLKNGLFVFCQIRDTGHGINAQDIQQIFEPFFTTRFVGRGLGLALAVGIIGHIMVPLLLRVLPARERSLEFYCLL